MINAFHQHRSIPLLGSLERVAPISRADISTLDNSFHRKKLKSFHNGFLRQTTLLETYEKPGRVDVSVSSSAAATEGKEHIRKRLGIIGCGQMCVFRYRKASKYLNAYSTYNDVIMRVIGITSLTYFFVLKCKFMQVGSPVAWISIIGGM